MSRTISRKTSFIVLAGATVLFVVSVSLLLFASTHREIPRWGGPVDGGVAFAVVAVSMWIYTKAAGKIAGKTIEICYPIAATLPAAILLAMWIFADRIIWNVLLPGVAWRTWLLLCTLPRAVALVRNPGRN